MAILPALKLPEQFGEAVPQLAIAVTFYYKNAHWLSQWEMFKGILTMTLSVGSILYGMVNGVRVMKGDRASVTEYFSAV